MQGEGEIMNKRNILLTPIMGTQKVLDMLEKKKLIRCLRPGSAWLRDKQGGCRDIYRTAPKYGAHKMIAVAKDTTEINLTTHPDNEDVILINNSGKNFKPLYLILATAPKKQFEIKAKNGKLSAKDVVAVELIYNSSTSVFTVLKDVPHCEVTVLGKGINPVFFVTEPADFEMDMVKQHGYTFVLK
jgi:hypothetical protein